MHPAATMKNWAHQLHDGMLRCEHSLGEHLHNRSFWIGIAALLFIGLMTALLIWAWRVQPESIDGFDYMYPYMYYRV